MKSKRKTELLQEIKDTLNSAASQWWDDVRDEINRNLKLKIYGYGKAELYVTFGGDEVLVTTPSKVVNAFIDHIVNVCKNGNISERLEWLNAVASDLEKQARRIRRAAVIVSKQEGSQQS
jgi:hypothetical protein